MDFKLGTDNDLVIENDDFVIIDGSAAIAQHLTIRLQFFLGEWFLDTRIGIDYFGQVFSKGVDITAVNAIFKQTILTTPGIVSIQQYASDFDPGEREFSIDFQAKLSSGEILDFSKRFIL